MANELSETRMAVAIAPGAVKDNAAFTSNVIDKLDFPGADYIEFVGVLGATDVSMAVLKVMESDTKTNDTTLGGTPALVKDATTKPGPTDDNKVFVFGIDLRASRQRYLQLQATAGDGTTGTYLSAIAIGRRLNQASSQAADRNLLFAEYA